MTREVNAFCALAQELRAKGSEGPDLIEDLLNTVLAIGFTDLPEWEVQHKLRWTADRVPKIFLELAMEERRKAN